mgnify:FL=1
MTTHRIVAMMMLYPLMKVWYGEVPWAFYLCWHAAAALAYLGMETVWSKSLWGIEPTEESIS